ncbi:hypothetical protein [Lacticaseibacillus porcinae]|uniref:hypothetical protein n=1 Tax=Lacticaseibacillus porcinae TaxID=1123687 RepID=UPI000F79EC86|nr:hypothetical protein [Lacticaseibacillus porcinae]
MFKLFGILLLGFAVWQLRAVYLDRQRPAPAGGVTTSSRESIGYALFMALVLVLMGSLILFGIF